MTTAQLKLFPHSFRGTLQYAGLMVVGVPASFKRLFFGGWYSEQIGGTPYTGQVELLVHQGGLRERIIPATAKKMFRQSVMPALTESFPEVGKEFSGKIMLYFNEGVLMNFELSH